jgi:two-component system chemotaxis response regulator CheB
LILTGRRELRHDVHMELPANPDPVRDLVVIGCSAGGVEALPRLLRQLPKDLPAAVLIVQHMAATGTPYLVHILERSSRMPVAWAEQGGPLARGRVIVGPPDVHLLCTDGHVALSKGPRENHARPSIDKLFRSAAATSDGRVIGVLLTGMLDDGVAGLRAIRAAGGAVIVQDPIDAAFPEMPVRALQALRPDRTLPLDAIGAAICELVGQPAGVAQVPERVALEAEIDRRGGFTPEGMSAAWPRTPLSCPDCHGPTWQLGDASLRRFRCFLGHAVTARGLLESNGIEIEAALWSAIRALNERAMTLDLLAADAAQAGDESGARYATEASEARTHAELARSFIRGLGGETS